MSDAINKPVTRQYNRREVHTGDMEVGQKADLDLSLDQSVSHGESLANISGDTGLNSGLLQELAFMEEPVMIRIEESGGGDFPETHVPVQVNGRGAEVLNTTTGKWMELTWLPIGVAMTVKRKYVEVLARSKSDSIRTQHEDATVERPSNRVVRRTKSNYPLSILGDDNPRGHEWLSRIMMAH